MKNTTTIQKQTFGVEIELTGITRKRAARVIARYFGTEPEYLGTYYDIWGAKDNEGRMWKCMSDSSIRCINIYGNPTDNKNYSCELVTPILKYEDLDTLKAIVNELQERKAVANSSTGIHVHVSADEHTARSLEALLDLAVNREGLLYEALQITSSRESRWCHKISKQLVDRAKKAESIVELEQIWYSRANDDYCWGVSHEHYNETRYHGVNLHSYFTGKGVEFRYFNGTTDADKIIAYVQLCLGISVWAINNPEKRIKSMKKGFLTNRQKMDQMYRLLQSFGMGIREYENLHKQMTAVWAQ